MKLYEVVVGNIGTVYRGSSKREAQSTFKYYVSQSQNDEGRAGGENVTYWEDNEPLIEFEGGNLKSFQTREEAKKRDSGRDKSSRKARVQRSKKLPSASIYQVQVYDDNERTWYPHSNHSTRRAAETAAERSYAFQMSSVRIMRKTL